MKPLLDSDKASQKVSETRLHFSLPNSEVLCLFSLQPSSSSPRSPPHLAVRRLIPLVPCCLRKLAQRSKGGGGGVKKKKGKKSNSTTKSLHPLKTKPRSGAAAGLTSVAVIMNSAQDHLERFRLFKTLTTEAMKLWVVHLQPWGWTTRRMESKCPQ